MTAPLQYLTGSDLATFGVASASTDDVIRATAAVNGFLRRPEGILWTPDATGNPCYMTGAEPLITFAAAGPIAPGQNVVVTVTPAQPVNTNLIGEVLILDRANATTVEACVVAAAAAGGQITLASVANAHAGPVTLDQGMTIKEQLYVPAKRSLVRVSRTPIVAVLSGTGQYGPGRRSEQISGAFVDYNLLAAVSAFGGPPLWYPIPTSQMDISSELAEVFLPAGMLIAYYSQARLWYLAGFSSVPNPVKQATATLIKAFSDMPTTAAIRSFRKGEISVDRIAETVFDADTKMQLDRYCAVSFR